MAEFANYVTLAENVVRTVTNPDPNTVSWAMKKLKTHWCWVVKNTI